jgi:hypothetical protein
MENAAVLKLIDAVMSLTQVFLIICEFEKCDFILILSTSLDEFQLVVKKLHRPSYRCLSANLVPTFSDRGCHVVFSGF